MALQSFESSELNFAFSNRIYFRFRSHGHRPSRILSTLNLQILSDLLGPYGIHVLESNCAPCDVKLLVSLRPTESASAAVSKIKGRISKCINDRSTGVCGIKQLGRGYFAVTTGKSSTESVSSYLERQSEHHGYDQRVRPPVFVKSFPHGQECIDILSTDHAIVSLKYHIVLATQRRNGVFCRATSEALTEHWRESQSQCKFVLRKISFLPDHVHIAVAVHPAITPAELILSLMNSSQTFMSTNFASELLRTKVSRLWQPSAYFGSFGELCSAAISAYVRRWEDTA